MQKHDYNFSLYDMAEIIFDNLIFFKQSHVIIDKSESYKKNYFQNHNLTIKNNLV